MASAEANTISTSECERVAVNVGTFMASLEEHNMTLQIKVIVSNEDRQEGTETITLSEKLIAKLDGGSTNSSTSDKAEE